MPTEKPRRGKAFLGWNKIVLLDANKLAHIAGKKKSKILRGLPKKMLAEIESNWQKRLEGQKAAGKRVWTSDALLRPGEPFVSQKHKGKVYVPVGFGEIGYKEHLEGKDGKTVKWERMKHPFNRARSLPYAIGLDAFCIVRTPEGKRYLYLQKRSMQVQDYKGWTHLAPATYPRAERKTGKQGSSAQMPFISLKEQLIKATERETGIPADRIKLLGPGFKPTAGKGVHGLAVIRTPAKSAAQVNLFPVIEVQGTPKKVQEFLGKADHNWETEGGPILVELTPKTLREFFKKNRAIYPQAMEQLIKALEKE